MKNTRQKTLADVVGGHDGCTDDKAIGVFYADSPSLFQFKHLALCPFNGVVMNSPLPTTQSVTVTDIDIKSWSLVQLLVKLAFAGIPAMLIVTIIVWGLSLIIAGVFRGVVPHG